MLVFRIIIMGVGGHKHDGIPILVSADTDSNFTFGQSPFLVICHMTLAIVPMFAE